MKQIPGWEGRYSITVSGSVWSHAWKRWRKPLNNRGYLYANLKRNGKQSMIAVHRLVAMTYIGAKSSDAIDHIDRNPSNNHHSNLRIATQTQNRANARGWLSLGNKFKGVFKYTKNGGWVAQICSKRLGTFPDAVSAAKAYDDAAIAKWGSFARVNFPRLEKTSTKQ